MEKFGKVYSVLEGHIVMAGGGMDFYSLSDFVTRTFIETFIEITSITDWKHTDMCCAALLDLYQTKLPAKLNVFYGLQLRDKQTNKIRFDINVRHYIIALYHCTLNPEIHWVCF